MKEELILEIKNGGIGDHLFYTHIPRIAKEAGYQKVFISDRSKFRNDVYKKLFWEANPHVDGFVDKPGTYPEFSENELGCNLLDTIMLKIGLDDGTRYHEPEVYFTPRKIPELADKVLYDPNYISNAGFVTSGSVSGYFAKNSINIDHQIVVLGKRAVPILNFNSFISCGSFEDFIDVIYSVKDIYCPPVRHFLERRI